MNKALLSSLCLANALLLGGCISSSKTEYVDEPEKLAVSFESSAAERNFYEGMAKNRNIQNSYGRPQEKHHVSLILVNVSNTKITSGPNRTFNEAVRMCDSDGNRTISNVEAENFMEASVRSNPVTAVSKTN